MDNGGRQQQMTKRIKSQVKQSAKRRRGIALMESIAQNLTATSPDDETLSGLDDVSMSNATLTRGESSSGIRSPSSSANPTGAAAEDVFLPDPPFAPPHTPKYSGYASAPNDQGSLVPRNETDMGFITAYMDYVFPALFPFYRPPILQGGRTWLLVLAMRNEGYLSTIVSLTSYFFSVVPVDTSHPDHNHCVSDTWKGLQKQMDLVLATVQDDLKDISRRGVGDSLLDSVYLLINIGQLLNFELAVPSGKWQIHLDAATGLSNQIIQHHASSGESRGISAVLDKLHNTHMAVPITPIQGAFRFFSAILLIDDIISSISLDRPPRLKAYHPELVQADAPDKEPTLRIEEVIGCHAWVLLAVSEIATLDQWKKSQSESGHLIQAELLSRANLIEKRLQEGHRRLDQHDLSCHDLSTSDSKSDKQLQAYLEHSSWSRDLSPPTPEVHAHLTRIWAHAAHSYLLVVLLGWQPDDARIRSNTTRVIDLLNKTPSYTWLRSVVWPFCVSGCLALGEQRQTFSMMGDSMAALQTFGTLREALSVMENVWGQSEIDVASWDLGSCLKSLGHVALLV
ncbi:hypothetical protein QQX98_004698 [Neonectria punicea]|uniref:Transcription factor domain-containing protein n=1 Tax=Neonectria punicea TaxID=979145 RepID=A0ABR1H825_9HYPO